LAFEKRGGPISPPPPLSKRVKLPLLADPKHKHQKAFSKLACKTGIMRKINKNKQNPPCLVPVILTPRCMASKFRKAINCKTCV